MSDNIDCPFCGVDLGELHEWFEEDNTATVECCTCGCQLGVERDFTVHYYVLECEEWPKIPAIPLGYTMLKVKRDQGMIPASSLYCAAGDKEWTPLGFRTWPKDKLVYIIKDGDQ